MKRAVFILAMALATLACGQTGVSAQVPPEIPQFASSGDAEFDAWRDDFAVRALRAGRSLETVRTLLAGVQPDPHIIELDQRQPEFVAPVWDYVSSRVSDNRIANGIALKASLGGTLAAIQQRYGVDADIVVGIWGLESNYGSAPLTYSAPQALATLAYEGRRRAQFENFLLSLMEMVDRRLASPEELKSSWAGAMGQPQFMPDVYLSTAVDWDGDGKRDIWSNRADIAASIANYLHDRGWRANEPVFDEVALPANFDYALADGSTRSVADWDARGVRRIDGAPWPDVQRTLQSQLFLPAGADGPALLLHPNFAVIRRYNNSDRYALVVALLARSYEGGRAGLQRPWPRGDASLTRDQTLELQILLNSLGYNAGSADGLFGSGTRRAVRAFQTDRGLRADGYPTPALLAAVRTRAGVSVDPPPAPPRALDRDGVRELQRRLTRLGYHPGRADGRIGPDTRAAIREFERRHGMEVRGRATTAVLDAVRDARR
ncbi:MAG TPA: lytic murein transglycosylase [Caulobacterales bacterium]|nr:lytic murein transglycosylase [Caulobacterales bacterium]